MQKNSWLYSDSFLKRSFAIWGHHMVANLIIMACFWIVIALFLLLGVVAQLGN